MSHDRLGTQNRKSAYYPRFSAQEFDRRYSRVREMMGERDLDALVAFGMRGFRQDNLYYLTNYQASFATYVVFFADPALEPTLFVGLGNHLQYVREASVIDDVRLLLPDPPANVIERIREADADRGRIGIVGDHQRYRLTLPHPHYEALDSELAADLVDVTAPYKRLIGVMGEEELERVLRAGEILDEAMETFADGIEPGVSALDLDGLLERSCRAAGGRYGTRFISTAPMTDAEPGEPLPWRRPSPRPIETGDVVTTEISASFRGYGAQTHRPYAVGRSPTDTYSDLFAVAAETFEACVEALQPGNTARDVYEAMRPVEESEYKVYDEMVHGFGPSLRPPYIGVEASDYWPGAEDPLTANWIFEPGMVVVVQPNVVTPDERAGLQFGTTVIVRDGGPQIVSSYPAEFTVV